MVVSFFAAPYLHSRAIFKELFLYFQYTPVRNAVKGRADFFRKSNAGPPVPGNRDTAVVCVICTIAVDRATAPETGGKDP